MSTAKGKLLFITGCMYSGKTNYLLDKYLTMKENNSTFLFKNDFDDAKKGNFVKSRTGLRHPATSIHDLSSVVSHLPSDPPRPSSYVFIDEIQFFAEDDFKYISLLLQRGYNFIVSGLDRDYRGEFFPISKLIDEAADQIEVLYARCHVCNSPARHTYRQESTHDLYVLDDGNNYQARCGLHNKKI